MERPVANDTILLWGSGKISERSLSRLLAILTIVGFLAVAGLTILSATNRAIRQHPASPHPRVLTTP